LDQLGARSLVLDQHDARIEQVVLLAHRALERRILTRLRAQHPALQRNEISFFHFHPQFDNTQGCRVFAYARTAGNRIGNSGQVVVLANMGAEKFPAYVIPDWPWGGRALTEAANPGAPGPMPPPAPFYDGTSNSLTLALNAFQVRVFTC
jgi:hypothetical protein